MLNTSKTPRLKKSIICISILILNIVNYSYEINTFYIGENQEYCCDISNITNAANIIGLSSCSLSNEIINLNFYCDGLTNCIVPQYSYEKWSNIGNETIFSCKSPSVSSLQCEIECLWGNGSTTCTGDSAYCHAYLCKNGSSTCTCQQQTGSNTQYTVINGQESLAGIISLPCTIEDTGYSSEVTQPDGDCFFTTNIDAQTVEMTCDSSMIGTNKVIEISAYGYNVIYQTNLASYTVTYNSLCLTGSYVQYTLYTTYGIYYTTFCPCYDYMGESEGNNCENTSVYNIYAYNCLTTSGKFLFIITWAATFLTVAIGAKVVFVWIWRKIIIKVWNNVFKRTWNSWWFKPVRGIAYVVRWILWCFVSPLIFLYYLFNFCYNNKMKDMRVVRSFKDLFNYWLYPVSQVRKTLPRKKPTDLEKANAEELSTYQDKSGLVANGGVQAALIKAKDDNKSTQNSYGNATKRNVYPAPNTPEGTPPGSPIIAEQQKLMKDNAKILEKQLQK